MGLFRSLKSGFRRTTLSVVRRGRRHIIWIPASVRGGNILYYWLNATIAQWRNQDVLLLATDKMSWLQTLFPLIDLSLINRSDVRIHDQRIVPPPLQAFGIDFSANDLDRFIAERLMIASGPLLQRVHGLAGRYDLTVNVRRGDYYSVPKWRGEYSFDVVEYVRTALDALAQDSDIRSIHVVSDDIAWCRVKLAWLSNIAPVTEPDSADGPETHLAMLTASPRLILANSTFSYWGGYLSRWFHAGRESQSSVGIWAPWFHNRFFPDGGRAVQLDPRWNIIRDIPAGWDG